tara:strand:+ start:948 stop:1181 length:234 start_codon:yes stop_codon:yes gene_type:complete
MKETTESVAQSRERLKKFGVDFDTDYPTTKAVVLDAILHISRDAAAIGDANEIMKLSQAALNLAHVLASLDREGVDT